MCAPVCDTLCLWDAGDRPLAINRRHVTEKDITLVVPSVGVRGARNIMAWLLAHPDDRVKDLRHMEGIINRGATRATDATLEKLPYKDSFEYD